MSKHIFSVERTIHMHLALLEVEKDNGALPFKTKRERKMSFADEAQ